MKTQSFVRRVLFVVFFAVIAAFFVASSVIASDDILPTWRSVTGKFSVEASLVRVTADSAVLKREDGSEMLVPLEKLDQPSLVMVLRFMNGSGVSQPQKPKVAATKSTTSKTVPANKVADDMFNIANGAAGDVAAKGGDYTFQDIVNTATSILPKMSGTDIQKQKQFESLEKEINRRFKDRKCIVKLKVKNVQKNAGGLYFAYGDFMDRKTEFRYGSMQLLIKDVSTIDLGDVLTTEGNLVTGKFIDSMSNPRDTVFSIGTHCVVRDEAAGPASDRIYLYLFNLSQRIEHAKK